MRKLSSLCVALPTDVGRRGERAAPSPLGYHAVTTVDATPAQRRPGQPSQTPGASSASTSCWSALRSVIGGVDPAADHRASGDVRTPAWRAALDPRDRGAGQLRPAASRTRAGRRASWSRDLVDQLRRRRRGDRRRLVASREHRLDPPPARRRELVEVVIGAGADALGAQRGVAEQRRDRRRPRGRRRRTAPTRRGRVRVEVSLDVARGVERRSAVRARSGCTARRSSTARVGRAERRAGRRGRAAATRAAARAGSGVDSLVGRPGWHDDVRRRRRGVLRRTRRRASRGVGAAVEQVVARARVRRSVLALEIGRRRARDSWVWRQAAVEQRVRRGVAADAAARAGARSRRARRRSRPAGSSIAAEQPLGIDPDLACRARAGRVVRSSQLRADRPR